jgi:hypothetical protein
LDSLLAALSNTNGFGEQTVDATEWAAEAFDRELLYLTAVYDWAGIDTANATGRMVAGVLASLAELELELGRERRTAARDARRARGQPIGRPKALDQSKIRSG